jgi:hypothetical protein
MGVVGVDPQAMHDAVPCSHRTFMNEPHPLSGDWYHSIGSSDIYFYIEKINLTTMNESLKKKLFPILILGVAAALVLDAVNIDDLVLSHGMQHEEYCGQQVESAVAYEHTQQPAPTLTAAQRTSYRQVNDVPHTVFLVDEDSPSLPAHPTITQDMNKVHADYVVEMHSGMYIHSYNFYYFCKIQI